MISLLRAVARSNPYRANRQYILGRDPQDIWHVPGEGWVVTYRLIASRWGQVLVFILGELSEDGRTSVTFVDRGAQEGHELTNDPELDLSL